MNRREFIAAGAAAGVGAAILAAPGLERARAATAPYTWYRPVVNGGMCNVIAADPNTAAAFYAGGDMYGEHSTFDAGSSWTPMMWGASSIGDTYARAVAASLISPGTAYYGIATLASGGGHFAVCSGYKIEYRSSAVGFGTALGSGKGGVMPRPVGSMIDVTMTGGVETIWVASSKGIAYSTDQGHTWHISAGTSAMYRAIAQLSPTSALAALYNTSGLTLVSGGVVSHPAAPGIIHDLKRINTSVYACGPGGVYTWNGTTLVPIASNSFFAGSVPVSIDGVGQTIVVGCNTPGTKCAALSTDGGASWTWLGGRQILKLRNGNPYWLSGQTNGFGGPNYAVSQVAVDKQNPLNVMFAGRSGVWASTDGCKTIYPVGPGGSEDTSVKVGPGAAEFACTDVDWKCLHTTDGWQTMNRLGTAPGGNTGLTTTVGGVTYTVKKGQPCDITKNGVSIANDYYRGAAPLAKCVGANLAGMVTIGLYGGGVLVGHP